MPFAKVAFLNLQSYTKNVIIKDVLVGKPRETREKVSSIDRLLQYRIRYAFLKVSTIRYRYWKSISDYRQ